jgi:hypothetical protein
VLRLLGPVVVILTLMLASCVALLLVGRSWLPPLLKVHKASFLLWFGAMTIHVLGHQPAPPYDLGPVLLPLRAFTTARRAVGALRDEGLVYTVPQRGTYVAQPTPSV